jgi:branched-chain amino acid transport system permease protein
VWLGVNLAKTPSDFASVALEGLTLGLVYGLIALGYSLVYGILELINFAHGDVFMLGSWISFTVAAHKIGLDESSSGFAVIWGLALTLFVAMAFCGLLNVTIERLAYRPLRNAPRLAPLITAIGVSILLQTFAMMIWGRSPLPFPQLLSSEPIMVGGAVISQTQVLLLVLAALSMLGMVFLVEKTKMGRAMRAVAENPRVAGLMGVDSNRVVVTTFAIGAALAAVAGVMWGANYASIQFAMGTVPGMKAFSAAVLGGIGNIYGAMIGGIVLGIIESLGAGYIGDLTGGFLGSHYQDIFAFVVLILVLTVRPSGIMGERVADRA